MEGDGYIMTLKTYLIIYICNLLWVVGCILLWNKQRGRLWYYPYVFATDNLIMLFITMQFAGVV